MTGGQRVDGLGQPIGFHWVGITDARHRLDDRHARRDGADVELRRIRLGGRIVAG